MRRYSVDSPSAAGRIVALCMVVDGKLSPSELRALHHSRLLEYIEIDLDAFHLLVEELCEDMLASAVQGQHVELAPATLDALLDEVRAPPLRQQLLSAMWRIATADGVLAEAEVTLLSRALARWAPHNVEL